MFANKNKKAWSISMLSDTLAQKQEQIQDSLFPWLVEEIGEINEKQQQLISTLELLRVEWRPIFIPQIILRIFCYFCCSVFVRNYPKLLL